jgi:aromatic-L-amino-acid/L-tryptophan decarboxylase
MPDAPAPADLLLLTPDERAALWERLTAALEAYIAGVDDGPAVPVPGVRPEVVREGLAAFDFAAPLAPGDAVDAVVAGLTTYAVHTPHPRYFGLFNPAPTTMGVAADALVAVFNPQLAAWSHAPFANEVERHLVDAFAERFGYEAGQRDGTFTSGGSEANHTALLCALAARFPAFAEGGARALDADPVLYVSELAHHSFVKLARACGLGTQAVRTLPVDDGLRLAPGTVRAAVAEDRAAGRLPFMIVATAGSTSAGVVDDLHGLADLADAEGLWLHADAAWGGAAALVPELHGLLGGLERADSITFDAHKFLSVPMGAGLLLTRHVDVLSEAFGIRTAYMPAHQGAPDPYAHSIQWSRRAIGMKVFLSLLVAGWEGYADAIRHQTAMGERLRTRLADEGWTIVNRTPLPVVCFTDDGADAARLQAIADAVVRAGAWISTTRLDAGRPVLRACVTSYRTTAADVDALVAMLAVARASAG